MSQNNKQKNNPFAKKVKKEDSEEEYELLGFSENKELITSTFLEKDDDLVEKILTNKSQLTDLNPTQSQID